MKYLCLISCEEKRLNALSKSELDALIDEALAYDLDNYLREMKRRERKHGHNRT
jgi:hypothetical protein